MGFPTFDEFRAALSPDLISQIIQKHSTMLSGTNQLLNEEGLAEYTAKVIGCAVMTSVEVLATYHKWLSEHVQQPDPHQD